MAPATGRRAATDGVRLRAEPPGAGDDEPPDETVGDLYVDGGLWRIASASARDDSASLDALEWACAWRAPPRLRREGVGTPEAREGVGRPVGSPDRRGARGVDCDMSVGKEAGSTENQSGQS
jgi:hypothetical protein